MACTSLNSYEHEEFQQIFCHFDRDGDDKISVDELIECMKMVDEDLTETELDALLVSRGLNIGGSIGFDEFVRLVGIDGVEQEEEEGGGRSSGGFELREAFEVFEMEGEGCITPKSLRRTLSMLGASRTVEDCTVMISRFDLDGDGVLSFEEFANMILQ